MNDDIPDVRDGLTRKERVVLLELRRAEAELGPRVRSALLYGRVLERIDLGIDEFQHILQRLTGHALPEMPRRRGSKR